MLPDGSLVAVQIQAGAIHCPGNDPAWSLRRQAAPTPSALRVARGPGATRRRRRDMGGRERVGFPARAGPKKGAVGSGAARGGVAPASPRRPRIAARSRPIASRHPAGLARGVPRPVPAFVLRPGRTPLPMGLARVGPYGLNSQVSHQVLT